MHSGMLALLVLALQLPTVQQVLDRNVQATGGREALLRHTSMTLHGSSDGVETVLYTSGTKAVQKVLFPNGRVFTAGYDGQTAWSIDTAGHVALPHGDIVKTIARDADMYYHLHVLRYFKSMAVIDVKDFDGHPCYHLRGVNNWGQTNNQYYDTATGILRGYAFNTAWRGGKGDATQTFQDYQRYGGVLMPAKTIGRDGDDVSVETINSVTWDDVPDSVFALPEVVRKAKQ
jgi:hypothetical protein